MGDVSHTEMGARRRRRRRRRRRLLLWNCSQVVAGIHLWLMMAVRSILDLIPNLWVLNSISVLVRFGT